MVILHGYTDNKGSYLDQARFLFERGYPSLIYDQRGHGQSASAKVSLGPLEARDLAEAIRMLSERSRGNRFVVWGISMGAATALLAAADEPQIVGSSPSRATKGSIELSRIRFVCGFMCRRFRWYPSVLPWLP